MTTRFTIMRQCVTNSYWVIDAPDRDTLLATVETGFFDFANIPPTLSDGDMVNVKVFDGDVFDLKKTGEEGAPIS